MACEGVQFSKKTHGDGAGIVRKLDANRKRIPATCATIVNILFEVSFAQLERRTFKPQRQSSASAFGNIPSGARSLPRGLGETVLLVNRPTAFARVSRLPEYSMCSRFLRPWWSPGSSPRS